MIEALRKKLLQAQTGEPTGSLDTAVGVYKEAACYVAALEALQREAKELITEIFIETGATDVKTSCGRVYVTRPSTVITYKAKELDALAANDDELSALLTPFRAETMRAGVLTIR